MSSGRLCSQSDAAADIRVQSDSFFEYLKTTDALLDGYRRNADDRVRIAIIDSGVDTQHPHIQQLRAEAKGWPRLTTASFVGSVSDGDDHVGHGTHITVTVMRIAKWAEIYVATVVDAQGVVHPRSVAKALMHSMLEWKVDIISLSLGFDRGNRRIEAALKEADRLNILVFAAVSNYGAAALRQIAWPASMTKVFGINSANFDGVTSSFNPPENDNDTFSRYKFLGEGVRSAWPLHKGEGEEKILSGTSMAAPIAGATASLFIEFMRQNSQDEEAAADAEIMETPDGMREIFHLIGNAKSKGDFFKYVTPWHLLNSTGGASVKIDRKHTLGRIREVLRGLRMYNSEGHDTSTDASGEPVALFSNGITPNAARFPFPSPVANLTGQRTPLNMTERRESEETWGTRNRANSRQQGGHIRAKYPELLHATDILDRGYEIQQAIPSPIVPFGMGYIPNFPPPQNVIPHRPYLNPRPQYFSPQDHESQQRPHGEGSDNMWKSSGTRRRSHNRVSANRNPSTNVRHPAELTAENLKAKNRMEQAEMKRLNDLQSPSGRATLANDLEISITEVNSENEDDTGEEDNSKAFTIKITGQATVMLGRSMITCEEGGEIEIRKMRTTDSSWVGEG